MQCRHCGWRNPASQLNCELCGELTAGAVPLKTASVAGHRLNVVAREENAPRQARNPLLQRAMQLALDLAQGRSSPEDTLAALDAFWRPVEDFLQNELPQLVATSAAPAAEMEQLADQGSRELRAQVAEIRTLLTHWSAAPNPARLGRLYVNLQGALNVIASCKDLDEAHRAG
jgi:hypothetical protein